jgi:hypothetical protein
MRSILLLAALAVAGGNAEAAGRKVATDKKPAKAGKLAKPKIRSAKGMGRFLSDKKAYRKLSPTLTRGEFDAKFEVALEAPSKLVRSYAGVFWRLARKAPPKNRRAGVGKVFGDAHRENFGFVRIGGKTVYGMTDYDDSGEGFVDDDAAHYFAELRLNQGRKSKLVDRAIAQYASVVAGGKAVEIDPDLAPDWDKTTRNDLDSTVRGKKFRYDKNRDLRPARRNERKLIEQAISGSSELDGYHLLDVAELIRVQGGSGGLARYWLLVEPKKGGGDPFTIELKEIPKPGVAESGVKQESDPAVRLAGLKKAFWGTAGKSDWFPIDLNGTPFLVRNRHSVEKVDLKSLKKSDHEKVILAQVSYMAQVHRAAWNGARAADIEKDVAARTADFARAYRKAHKRLAD